MTPFEEEDHVDSLFPLNYRAKIIAIDNDNKNGIYKVRVYPMMEGIGEEFLPYATSMLTTRYSHIQLKVGDMVWVFFENGDRDYPVIQGLCNAKGKYPQAVDGTYGEYDKWTFGPNGEFTAEYDETNKKLYVKIAGGATLDIGTLLTLQSGGLTGTSLKTILEFFLTTIQHIITPGNFIGNMGVPIIPGPVLTTDLTNSAAPNVTPGNLLEQ